MIDFLKKYKAFFIGLIVIPIFYLLKATGVIILPEDRKLSIIPYLIFWGLAIALPIHHRYPSVLHNIYQVLPIHPAS